MSCADKDTRLVYVKKINLILYKKINQRIIIDN